MVKAVVAALFAGAEAGSLAVTWEDCGGTHATVTGLAPLSVPTGTTATLMGTGTIDEDVTSAHFTAKVTAAGATLAQCSGDGTSDIECKLPLGAGVITVKALSFPLAKGTVQIPVSVKTSVLLPASLAKVDVHVEATEQNGESAICLDVHTAKEGLIAPVTGTMTALSDEDVAAQADACLAQVNKYRATKGRAAITLKSGQMSCAGGSASKDGPNLNWHGSFGQCGENAQCEAAGSSTCSASIDQYYNEGPGGGHYEIIMSANYRSMAYGYCACSKYGHFWTHNFYTTSSTDVQV